ncbi:MAG: hypothetical protein MHM6MM_002350 [Cercozoa sp. M6MM]
MLAALLLRGVKMSRCRTMFFVAFVGCVLAFATASETKLGHGDSYSDTGVPFIYTPEICPTEWRAAFLGTMSSVARLGAMAAPLLVATDVKTACMCLGASALVITLCSRIMMSHDTHHNDQLHEGSQCIFLATSDPDGDRDDELENASMSIEEQAVSSEQVEMHLLRTPTSPY